MSRMIPERVAAFRVYQDGKTDLVGVADIQLPSFEMATETVKGAGIAGEFDSPTVGHFQSMKFSMNWRTVSKEMLLTLRQQTQGYDCRGAIQTTDPATGNQKTSSVRVVVRGRPTKLELGKFETAAAMDSSTELEVLYIKVDIDGHNMVEIDKLNDIVKINGVDYRADIRSALGL